MPIVVPRSPATHGTALATYLARKTLQRAGARLYKDTITKADLTIAVTELRADLDKGFNRVRTELLFWMIGTVGLGVLVNHFWR